MWTLALPRVPEGSRVSKAHLAEAKSKIERALDAQYMYNTNDLGSISIDLGGMFMQEQADQED